MTHLPLEQLSKGQGVAPQLQVEPDAKVMQGHFGRQTGLKAVQHLPMRFLQPISAWPANQPVPRSLASRVGMPELSSASYRQCCACMCSTRNKLNATMTSR